MSKLHPCWSGCNAHLYPCAIGAVLQIFTPVPDSLLARAAAANETATALDAAPGLSTPMGGTTTDLTAIGEALSLLACSVATGWLGGALMWRLQEGLCMGKTWPALSVGDHTSDRRWVRLQSRQVRQLGLRNV